MWQMKINMMRTRTVKGMLVTVMRTIMEIWRSATALMKTGI